MLDQLFLMVNSWMTGSIGLALVGSFLWGMVSVLFSPCHLASIPLIRPGPSGHDGCTSRPPGAHPPDLGHPPRSPHQWQ